MDKFPDDFNRKVCYDIIEFNQSNLLKKTRQDIYDIIMNDVQLCERQTIVTFPERLWEIHRIQIVRELLERFNKVKLTTINSQHTVVKIISDIENVPDHIKQVTIDLIKI